MTSYSLVTWQLITYYAVITYRILHYFPLFYMTILFLQYISRKFLSILKNSVKNSVVKTNLKSKSLFYSISDIFMWSIKIRCYFYYSKMRNLLQSFRSEKLAIIQVIQTIRPFCYLLLHIHLRPRFEFHLKPLIINCDLFN